MGRLWGNCGEPQPRLAGSGGACLAASRVTYIIAETIIVQFIEYLHIGFCIGFVLTRGKDSVCQDLRLRPGVNTQMPRVDISRSIWRAVLRLLVGGSFMAGVLFIASRAPPPRYAFAVSLA